MKKIIIFCIIIICFLGCKTVRNNIKETYTEKKNTVTEAKEDKKESAVITSEITLDEDLNIIETVTRFTLPDSTGKQHIAKIIKREIKRKKIETGAQKTETETQEIKTENIVEKIDIKDEVIDKTITKVETPAFITYLFVFGGSIIIIAIVIALFLFFKKYHII
jgi:hypothetical protein